MEIVCSPCGIVDIEHCGQGVMDIARAGFPSVLLDLSLACGAHDIENMGSVPKTAAAQRRTAALKDPSALAGQMGQLLETCAAEGLGFPLARAPYLRRDTKHANEQDGVKRPGVRAGDFLRRQGGKDAPDGIAGQEQGADSLICLPGEGAVPGAGVNSLLACLAEEGIRICGTAGCHAMIVRPLFAGIRRGQEWEANRAYCLRLAAAAKENQVTLLLENQCRDINGHLVRGICSDGAQAAMWVDRLNEEAGEERFGFCMDTGALSLCGQNMREYALALGCRLKAVILRDCDGHRENSLLPFTCVNGGQPQTDWLGLVRGLREGGFDGQLVLDLADTAAAFSPLLRPQLLGLAGAVAEYIKWQAGMEGLLKKYPKRVLFGAGNMCRNYMKCYGRAYPPLFTCDNNRVVWGQEFCGLQIREPAALLDLPEDCAVLICNIYYREIEKQLRDMGVKNPVEFFNDEYMPSFYFDRVEDLA